MFEKLDQIFEAKFAFLESGFFGKCRILSRLRREGLSGVEFQQLFHRLIPRPLLLRIRLARNPRSFRRPNRLLTLNLKDS